jgi:hypothetical protein
MNANRRLPVELAAIAGLSCAGGAILLLSVAAGAVYVAPYPFPDRAMQTLFRDPAARPLMICEGAGALVLGVAGVVAGVMTFKRARAAGVALRGVLVLAAVFVVADVVVQGWLIVPALRRLAPTLKWPHALMYDPRLRPWWPIATGAGVLFVLFIVARVLRRPEVRP